MPNTLRTLGTLAGVVGLLTCLFAGLARLTGIHWLMGFEIVTLLQIGIGGMVSVASACCWHSPRRPGAPDRQRTGHA